MPPLVRSASVYALARGIPGLCGLIAALVFVRVAGADAYGRYAVMFAAAVALADLATGWLSLALLRFTPRMRDGLPHIHSALRSTRLAAQVAALLVLAVLFVPRAHARLDEWLLGAGLLLASGLHALRLAGWQSRGMQGRFALLEAVRAISGVALALLFASRWPQAQSLLAGMLLGYLAALAWPPPWHVVTLSPVRARRLSRVVRSYAWPLAFWLALFGGLPAIERLLLQSFLGDRATGIYAASYEFIVRAYALATFPLTLALHAPFMTRWRNARADALRDWRRVLCWQAAVVLLAIPMAGLFAPPLLRALAGVEVPALLCSLLAAAGGLWQIALVAHKPMEAAGFTRAMLILLLAAVTAQAVGLTVVLAHGATLAAAAAVGGLAAMLYLLGALYLSHRLTH